MSLYQKYRPQKFADLVGQEAIKKTLMNALKSGQISHAYLFVGPRGSGKTTSARLMAKALNCKNRKPGQAEPCNECTSCLEIASGHALDVIEIDAASNRGIDDVRQLRDKIMYAPTNAAYKVFIIDEVHMLTKESFNALLKTLEEPPKHAVFILATTEPEKVLETILSRVQEFQFSRATINEVKEDLNKIIAAEKINIDPEALNLIAGSADGSFRDAESILDQVTSMGEKKISLELTQKIMGLVDDKVTGNFITYILENNPQAAIELINQIHQDGYNLVDFNNRLIEYLRSMMLVQAGINLQSNISELELNRIKDLLKKTTPEQIFKMINKFIATGQLIKTTQMKQLPLELAVYDLLTEPVNEVGPSLPDKSESSTLDKQSVLKTAKEKVISKPIKKVEKTNSKPIESIQQEVKVKSKSTDKQVDLKKNWPKLVSEISKTNYSLTLMLKDSDPLDVHNGKLRIGVKNNFYADRICDSKNYEIIANAAQKVLSQQLGVECVVQKTAKSSTSGSQKEANSELVNEAMDVFEM